MSVCCKSSQLLTKHGCCWGLYKVSAKEPTYDGEADIIPDIIEPSGGGLDIPTIIHGSAAEAINLSVYPEEIRNRIEEGGTRELLRCSMGTP